MGRRLAPPSHPPTGPVALALRPGHGAAAVAGRMARPYPGPRAVGPDSHWSVAAMYTSVVILPPLYGPALNRWHDETGIWHAFAKKANGTWGPSCGSRVYTLGGASRVPMGRLCAKCARRVRKASKEIPN